MFQLTQLIKFLISSPIPLFLIFFIFIILFHKRLGAAFELLSKKSYQLLKIASTIALICLVVVTLIYLFSNIFLDVISPSIVSVSWLFARGEEIYHATGANKIYSLLYGPAAYIVNGFFMKVLGPSMFSSKLASVGSLVLTFVFTYLALAKFLKKRKKLLFLGLSSALFLLFWTFPFEARPDSMALMFAALALFGATKNNFTWSVILTGIALGVGLNLKISALFYFIPSFFLLYKKFGVSSVATSLLLSAIVVTVPFLVFGNVDFGNYVDWLSAAGKHPLEPGSFANNILYTLFLFLPLLVFLSYMNKEQKSGIEVPYLKFLFLGMVVTSIVAAKAGSGQNHLLPFIPFILYGYAMFYSKHQGVLSGGENKSLAQLVLIPFVLAVFAIAFANTARILRLYSIYPIKAGEDIHYILEQYPHAAIHMGYSDSPGNANLNTNLPSFRPLLVFAGNQYVLDKPALGDLRESGSRLSNSFLNNFRNCKDEVWLFTRNTKPFENVAAYGKLIFEDDFYNSFYKHHQFKESSEYYDIWTCVNR